MIASLIHLLIYHLIIVFWLNIDIRSFAEAVLKKIAQGFLFLYVLFSLSGCVAVTVVSAAVSVTTTVVGGAVDVVDTVTPDIIDDEE